MQETGQISLFSPCRETGRDKTRAIYAHGGKYFFTALYNAWTKDKVLLLLKLG